MYEVAEELERLNLEREIPELSSNFVSGRSGGFLGGTHSVSKLNRDYARPEELECWSERDFEDVLPAHESITADDY